MLSLPQVTAICYENRDDRAALSLLLAMSRKVAFGSVLLHNWHRGYAASNYACNFEAWRYVKTSHALSLHLDGYIVNPDAWTDLFLSYDYVGAPWPEDRPHRVGNDGFSLKSRRLMTRVAELEFDPKMNSDELICIKERARLESEGFRFAPVDVAARFSTECVVPETVVGSFGFHGKRLGHPVWSEDLL